MAIVWVVLPWNDFRSGLVFFTSLHHSSADYATHRGQYGHGTAAALSSVAYIGGFLRFGVLPPLAWIGLFHIKQTRRLIPIVAFALGLLVIIGFATGQKQPELYIGVGLVLAFLIRSERPSLFNWKVAALAAAGLLVIIPALYHFQYPQLGYPTAAGVNHGATHEHLLVHRPASIPFLSEYSSLPVRSKLSLRRDSSTAAAF